MKKPLPLFTVAMMVTLQIFAQEWTSFNPSNSALPSGAITSLVVNDSGKVYAGTVAGLAVYNNGWQRLNVATTTNMSINRLVADSSDVWVGSEDGGIWLFSKNTWTKFSGQAMLGFGVDSKNSIFRVTRFLSFDQWNGSSWTEIIPYFYQAINVFVDRQDNVWVLSTSAGLKQYKDGNIISWPSNNPANPNQLPYGAVYDMTQDKNGIYWIASDGGLIRFDGTNFQLFNTANSGINSNRLRCLSFDKNGNLWIGTRDAGVCKWNGSVWQTFNNSNSPIYSPIINDIAVDSSNRVWVANGYNELMSPQQGQGVFMYDENIDFSNGQLPAAPANLRANIVSVNQVDLFWDDLASNESGFILERSVGDNTNFQALKYFSRDVIKFTDLNVTGNNTYFYRIKTVNSKGSSAYSNEIQISPKYCVIVAGGTNYSEASAQKVVFGSINNTLNVCVNGYHNYLDQQTEIFQGQTIPLNLSIAKCVNVDDDLINVSVYIDWNSDGDFDDLNEMVYTKKGITGRANLDTSLTVPANVTPGTITRMRIRLDADMYSSFPAIPPCANSEETQDYTLVVKNIPASTKPTLLSFGNRSSRTQSFQWVDNANGELRYIIERSLDSVSFTQIASLPPNTVFYRDSLLQPDTKYFYRVQVVTAAGQTASNIVGAKTLSTDLIRQRTGDLTRSNGSSVGAYWGDFNKDKKYDLFASGNAMLYQNKGDSLNAVQPGFPPFSVAAWGDFDNDGDDDLYAGDDHYPGDKNVYLYENDGNGVLKPIPGLEVDNSVSNAVWEDYNNDGYLDIFIMYNNLGYGKLYRNNRDKTFSLVRKFDNVHGYASFADYDNDGDDDLVILGNSFGAVFNRKDSSFTQTPGTSLSLVQEYGRGVSWADFNNDGLIDVFIPGSFNSLSVLYVNHGNGFFDRRTDYLNLPRGLSSGSAWGDVDNDGYQDLFVASNQSINKIFYNRKTVFEEVPASAFINEDFGKYPFTELPSSSCAFADYNNDGFLDLYVSVPSAITFNRLYQNGTNQYNWINITLKGAISNSNAIGARIKLKANGQWQYRWVQSGSGANAHNSFPVEFGLGTASIIDSVIVHWPSGIDQVLSNIEKNKFISITEESKPTAVIDPLYTSVKLYPNPVSQKVYIELGTNQYITTRTAHLYDINGRVYQVVLEHLGGKTYSVNMERFSTGVYWLEIKEKQVLVRKKLLVTGSK